MPSDCLLHFITRLQNERSPTKRRQRLLDYICQSSGARFVVLFVWKPEKREFELCECSGRYPADMPQRVPMGGCLSEAQAQQGWVIVANGEKEQRMLAEEAAWAHHGAYAWLYGLQAGRYGGSEQGVLWIAMGDTETWKREVEEDVRACLALLPAYLSAASVEPKEGEDEGHMIGERGIKAAKGVEEVTPLTLLAGLEQLYALLLVGERGVEQEELYALALEQMRSLVGAERAWIYRYEAEEERFILAARTPEVEDADSVRERLPDARMLEELSEQEPGETLTALQIEDGVLWLLPLSYEPGLMGVAAFLLPEGEHTHPLRADIRLVLAYLARGTVLLLRDSEAHKTIQSESTLRERQRLARDIHDGPAQQLTLALLKLEYTQRLMSKLPQSEDESIIGRAISDLERVHTILRACVDDLRHTISSERPVELERESFGIAIRTLIKEFRTNNPNLSIDVTSNPAYLQYFPQEIETPVFRFVQEALNNVRKHAHASHVTIDARVQDEFLRVSVRDNGVGFRVDGMEAADAEKSGGRHMGLKAMRERIINVGGTFEVQSEEGVGTTTVACFPLHTEVPDLTERERDVIRLMSEGLTNRTIAERLSISVETVKTHIQHIMQKLQAKDRTQAVALALRRGLI